LISGAATNQRCEVAARSASARVDGSAGESSSDSSAVTIATKSSSSLPNAPNVSGRSRSTHRMTRCTSRPLASLNTAQVGPVPRLASRSAAIRTFNRTRLSSVMEPEWADPSLAAALRGRASGGKAVSPDRRVKLREPVGQCRDRDRVSVAHRRQRRTNEGLVLGTSHLAPRRREPSNPTKRPRRSWRCGARHRRKA
jgi:hypothetical protein